MFVGHYTAAFLAKSVDKTIPLWILFLAVQLVDVIWAVLVVLGVEKLRIVADAGAGPLKLDLYHMPFTHGVLAALGWAVVAFVLYRRLFAKRGRAPTRAAAVVAIAVLSHWVLDFLVHRQDLPLIGNDFKVGLGLWNYPVLALLLETAPVLVGIALYLYYRPHYLSSRTTKASIFPGRYGMPLFGVVLVAVQVVVPVFFIVTDAVYASPVPRLAGRSDETRSASSVPAVR